jgi:small subunit ribosomal protein S6
MTLPAPTYDLVLLLDAEADEQVHARILGEARAAIAAQGELLRDDSWGDRALSYPIHHKATAKYHLMQFHAGAPELLEQLDRSLRIADEVVRFRIVKLKPGTPEAPRTPPAAGEVGGGESPPAPPTPTASVPPPAAAPAEVPAEPQGPAVEALPPTAEAGAAQPAEAQPEAPQPV